MTDYDLIVVDEAHRRYILNNEMNETEMLYRNQDDYISKYRTAVEYFDAVKIALTATPAFHPTKIFGKPVFKYSYREAVIDGYLVDHDAPHNIRTKLRVEGNNYKKGERLIIYDPVTGDVLNDTVMKITGSVAGGNKAKISEAIRRFKLAVIPSHGLFRKSPCCTVRKELLKSLLYAGFLLGIQGNFCLIARLLICK